nr:hypothetical protein [Tanacetum cinerariifolium]
MSPRGPIYSIHYVTRLATTESPPGCHCRCHPLHRHHLSHDTINTTTAARRPTATVNPPPLVTPPPLSTHRLCHSDPTTAATPLPYSTAAAVLLLGVFVWRLRTKLGVFVWVAATARKGAAVR